MSSKLFGVDIAPACSYCANGKPNEDGSKILCRKKGVRMPFDSCRRFEYDPLLRVPSKQQVLSGNALPDEDTDWTI